MCYRFTLLLSLFIAASIEGADYRAAGFRECLSEVSRYLQSFQNPNCKEDQKAQLMSHLNTIISHRLYQSRPPMPPSVVWPRGVSSQVTYHDTTAALPLTNSKIKPGKPLTNMLHEDHVVNKDKLPLIQNQNLLIPPAIPDMGVRPGEPSRYSFTMYPTTHCTRNDNMMIRFPFAQHKDDMLKSEQIMLGPDPSLIKSLFCQQFWKKRSSMQHTQRLLMLSSPTPSGCKEKDISYWTIHQSRLNY